ncbi:MAG: RluA family pseudouridine synthase [Planctomycetes bacterium]|nr:RluA family pseudouridine synthase [Planctomycetota bacterium]
MARHGERRDQRPEMRLDEFDDAFDDDDIMPDASTVVVPDEFSGYRVSEVLGRIWPHVRRSAIRLLIREARIERNGQPVRAHEKLRGGDVLFLHDFDPVELPQHREDEAGRPDVLHEDAACLVIAKPAGLATTPEREGQDSVHDRLLGWFKDPELRIAHRLDKGTSGALLLAKGADAARAFDAMFQEHRIRKEYLALCRGRGPLRSTFSCDVKIGRTIRGGRVKIGEAKGAREAHTDFEIVERFRGYLLVKAMPTTGRMHQIRAHLSWLAMPLAVDPLYRGGKAVYLSDFKSDYRRHRGRPETPLMNRLSLHAHVLEFRSPDGDRDVRVECPPPKDFRVTLDKLRRFASSDARSATPDGESS